MWGYGFYADCADGVIQQADCPYLRHLSQSMSILMRLSKKGGIPHLMRSFFEREAIAECSERSSFIPRSDSGVKRYPCNEISTFCIEISWSNVWRFLIKSGMTGFGRRCRIGVRHDEIFYVLAISRPSWTAFAQTDVILNAAERSQNMSGISKAS